MYLQQTSGERLWRTAGGIMRRRRYDSDSCSSCSRQVEGGLRLRGCGGQCRRGALLGLRTLLSAILHMAPRRRPHHPELRAAADVGSGHSMCRTPKVTVAVTVTVVGYSSHSHLGAAVAGGESPMVQTYGVTSGHSLAQSGADAAAAAAAAAALALAALAALAAAS